MINVPTAKETNCMETKKAFLTTPAGKLWKAKKDFVKNLEQARMMRALKYWKFIAEGKRGDKRKIFALINDMKMTNYFCHPNDYVTIETKDTVDAINSKCIKKKQSKLKFAKETN